MINSLIKKVLLANSSQLAFNWIYNRKFLKTYSQNNEMLMTDNVINNYKYNKPSYNSYPSSKKGDLSFQGNILRWLDKEINNNLMFNIKDYENLLLKKLMPGGTYNGYVESFGKELVYKQLLKDLKINNDYEIDDDQLVGFIPYIIAKAYSLDNEYAFSLAKLLTTNLDYLRFYEIFDILMNTQDKQKDLEGIKALIPKSFINSINDALSSNDDSFIKSTKMLSCSINYALPIIFYLYNKYDSLMDALKENVILGGASSDRAMIITVLYPNSILDENWDKYIRG